MPIELLGHSTVNDGNLHAGFHGSQVQSYNAAAHPRARS
jgi:hypothetical protein